MFWYQPIPSHIGFAFLTCILIVKQELLVQELKLVYSILHDLRIYYKLVTPNYTHQIYKAIIGRYNSYYLVEYVGQTWVTQAYVGLVNKWSNCIVIYTVGFFCSIYEQKGAGGELHPGVEATWVNVLRSKHKAIPHFFLNYHRLHCRLLYLCKDFSDPHIYLSIYQTLRTKYKIHTTNAVDCRIRLNDALVENKVPKVALLFPTHKQLLTN